MTTTTVSLHCTHRRAAERISQGRTVLAGVRGVVNVDVRPGHAGRQQCVELQPRVRDRLTVSRLDRLGSSLPHLVTTVEDLGRRGVLFRLFRTGTPVPVAFACLTPPGGSAQRTEIS